MPDLWRAIEKWHSVSRKVIYTLSGTYKIINLGYSCSNETCAAYNTIFSSEEATHMSLWYSCYGMDIFAFIGEQRFKNHKTRLEIADALHELDVVISDREVEQLYEKYEHLLQMDSHAKREETYSSCMEKYGGIVLSLDGVQPAKGNETLYVLREVLSGTVIAACSMKNGSSKELKKVLEPYLDTEVPILGFITDGQRSIRKALKEMRPDVPYQFCQFHYLKDIAIPAVDADRKLKTLIKKNLRGLRDIEVKTENDNTFSIEERAVITGYCEAIRVILLEDGKPPLELPGIKIYERLEELKQSLEQSLESTLISKKNFKNRYLIVREMHEIIINIAVSLDKTELSTSKGHEEALKTLLEKAFQEKGEKRGLKGFMDNLKKYKEGFWEGLFVYYDHPLIPKTNNDLERFFHLAKQDYRRVIGNDYWGRYIQNHGEYSMFVYNYKA